MSESVRIVEVGPRDGLQNESSPIDTVTKVHLIDLLTQAGVGYIEAGSFVSPKAIPQMAGSDEVFDGLSRGRGVVYAALTPNMRGYDQAVASGADEVAVFSAASEAFNQRNINCSIAESLARFEPVMEAAARDQIKVRGYVSCVVGCPYEGAISPEQVRDVSQNLLDMGCYEISLGDTIGIGTPGEVATLLELLTQTIRASQLAVHCHDTYGQALANIYVALEHGIRIIDSSVAGLGGCPYADGATGNVASEDVVYMLHGLGYETGIDLDQLIDAGNFISEALDRDNNSRAANAISGKRSGS
ncbi:MAG: hydroxymethylglutaryl-CoA lyase [Gammaproteobacteria bacterium]|jgi:hydroxymethylglutaryl-CoA lyase|nr:hydroxymethylglutaryl-CoA lyase [Gammaproteobacteria bacterium]|tara:strand:+ start:270 stop:1175 length:906 start_codon:yes stop_codon:yes gene_type:complete